MLCHINSALNEALKCFVDLKHITFVNFMRTHGWQCQDDAGATFASPCPAGGNDYSSNTTHNQGRPKMHGWPPVV